MIKTRTPTEPTSLQPADNESTISNEEREKRVLALADDYYLETSKPGLTGEELAVVNQKWKQKLESLGVRSTNSMPQWFADGPGAYGAYDMDGKDAVANMPAVKYLNELKAKDRNLFEACRIAEQHNSRLHAEWLASGLGEEDYDNIIARWSLDLRMTEAFNHMLTYDGATEEILDDLTR